MQQPAAVADSNAPPPSEPFHRNLLSFSRANLRFSFIPVAGLPEIVLADVALSPSLKAASGSWSHAALLEAPILKCEKKSNRQTAHIAFQQVRCHELSHAACVLRHAHPTAAVCCTRHTIVFPPPLCRMRRTIVFPPPLCRMRHTIPFIGLSRLFCRTTL